MQNKLIGSGLVFSKIYEEKIVLTICKKNNLISGKNNNLLKVKITQSK